MDLAFEIKLLCDLSLWFSATGFILSYLSLSPMPVWPAGLILLCGFLSHLLKNGKRLLRLLPLLALAGCIAWIRSVSDALILLPPCLYCAWLCVKGRFLPDYESCLGYFQKAAPILSLFVLISFIVGAGPRVVVNALPWYITFLFSGIAMLRLLRHDEQARKEWRLWLVTLVSLVVCCAAALFLSSSAFLRAAGGALGALYRYVIQPVMMGIVYVFTGLVWLIQQVVSLFGTGARSTPAPSQAPMESFTPDQLDGSLTGGSDLVKKILLAVAIVLAIAIFIFLAYKLFKRLAESAGKPQDAQEIREKREAVLPGKERRSVRTLLAPRTPRDTVRWYYRKFLQKVKAGGFDLKPADTSESIARVAGHLFDPALVSELRERYIAARYSPEPVTADDVRKVREIYGKLKTKE